MSKPELKYKKVKVAKENRYEPYDYYEDVIVVPPNRHKLTCEQIKAARARYAKNNCCMICVHKFKSERDRCIDHCHVTGVIRGQICFSCNTALGHFKEDISTMRSALSYMEYFKYNPDMVDQDLWSNKNDR